MAAGRKQLVRGIRAGNENPDYRAGDRELSIRRALDFLCDYSSDQQVFEDYGTDVLWCFWLAARTSSDERLVDVARKRGEHLARRWARVRRPLLSDPPAEDILDLIHGTLAASYFGAAAGFSTRLHQLVPVFSVYDYLGFDPTTEPPAADVPERCECGEDNKRGETRCRSCGEQVVTYSPQKLWYDALGTTYTATRLGLSLGACYRDVIKWLAWFRRHSLEAQPDEPEFYDTFYAVTHVVYTLNDYGIFQLSPTWLPEEHHFLKSNFLRAMDLDDPDMTGEFLDTLKAFGMSYSDPAMRAGVDYLLATQNEDGSWGDERVDDLFDLLHATWTAVDGLRDYAWEAERLSFPELKTLILDGERLFSG